MPWRRSSLPSPRRHRGGLTAGCLLALLALPAAAQSLPAVQGRIDQPVDLALVMAIDTSASISREGFLFQLRGHVEALRSRDFAEAVANGRRGAVGLTVALWDGPQSLRQVVPWTRVAGAADLAAFADRLAAAEGEPVQGATAVGSAMLMAARLLEGIPADRKIVDISSNGFSNAGLDPVQARQALSKGDVTVNAVVVTDEYDWLPGYYEESVITGLNAFVVSASTGEGFVRALKAKLVTEVSGLPYQRLSGAKLAQLPR
ncbi:MAG TPA: DUF1194 domain-containing protein [Alphaproteobacteria bacterium]|nr:DUF1194 domain-containing protein [Alphaproteobacteria bacterium]